MNMPAVETLLANVRHGFMNGMGAEIGGGVFSPEELRLCHNQIRTLQARCERLEHDQVLLLQALKGLLEDPTNADRMKRANAAYRHVSGT